MPLFLFHLLEWMDQPYDLNIKAINARWAKKVNIDSWGQLIIKYTDKAVDRITKAPKTGIYPMQDDGTILFSRMDTHRRAVESEKEAFFLRISDVGGYRYEGADLGILVTRGRMMTDKFKLNERAKKWISAIRNEFEAMPLETVASPVQPLEIGGFKML